MTDHADCAHCTNAALPDDLHLCVEQLTEVCACGGLIRENGECRRCGGVTGIGLFFAFRIEVA